MSFKTLSDNQILALAIDEWLLGLDDEGWEEALRHIEMRKKQRANRRTKLSDSQERHSKPGNTPLTSQDKQEPL